MIKPVGGWKAILLLANFSSFVTAAQAQTGDWQAVKALKSGTVVSVRTHHRYLCTVDRVTSDSLVCQPRRAGIVPIPIPASFTRADIREIRLEHNQSKDAWVGAGVGAVTGASLGASTNRVSRVTGGFFGGLAGGMAGALIGATVPIVHHKEVIYKR